MTFITASSQTSLFSSTPAPISSAFASDAFEAVSTVGADTSPETLRPHHKEHDRLARWIGTAAAAPTGAVVGIVGPVGIGKTTLAIALAETLASERRVPLHVITCRDRKLSTLLREFIYRAAPDAPLVADAETWLKFREIVATRPAVIVLDDLTDIDAISRLALPGLQVIVTSRAPALSVPSVELRAWSPQEALGYLSERMGSLANDVALPKLCALVGNVPVALSLLAGHLAQTHAGLPSDCLRLLTDEHKRLKRLSARDDHKLAIDTALSFAYHRLSVSLQRVLRQLSVIPDAFTADIASQICDDAAAALPELVRRNLLVFNSGTGRYAWLSPVRAFARARMSNSEAVTAEMRHAQGVIVHANNIASDTAARNFDSALRAYDALRPQIDAAFVRSAAGFAPAQI